MLGGTYNIELDIVSSRCSVLTLADVGDTGTYTQRTAKPDQCYFTVQITGINFECSL